MQFLLLLSALLSAVTGAFAGTRAVEAPVSQAEAQAPAAERVAAVAQAAVTLPLQRRPATIESRPIIFTPAALPAAAPLADIRLNE